MKTLFKKWRTVFAAPGEAFLDEVSARDIDFVSHSDAAILEQSPKGGRYILWAVALFLVIAFLWAGWAELDEVARGEGKVIPSRQVQVIQNLEGGILSELLVAEGDIVESGQVLLRIDDTRFSSTLRESRLHYLTLVAKAARLSAEAEGVEFVAPEEVVAERPELAKQERALFLNRVTELDNNLEIGRQQAAQRQQELDELVSKREQLERSYELLLRELTITKPLMAQGVVSEVEVLRLERQVNEMAGELRGTKIAIPKAESRYAEANNKLEEIQIRFRNEARLELSEAVAELSRISESNRALEDRVRRTAVLSPVRGTVKQILVNTVGGVIQPGMDVMEIVPLDDSLLLEAQVRPADIAFLHPGQRAVVKFSAYDFAIYGGLQANVEHISADTINDERGDSYYLVRVRTEKSFLGTEQNPLPIIPGMVGTVDILTGKKTVLNYLLKPVLRAKGRALTER